MKKIVTLSIIIVVFSISSTVCAQQKTDIKIMEATYDGQSNNAYYFTESGEEKTIKFLRIKQGLLKNYNLEDEMLIGKKFMATYRVDQEEVIPNKGQMNIKDNVKFYRKAFVLLELEELIEY